MAGFCVGGGAPRLCATSDVVSTATESTAASRDKRRIESDYRSRPVPAGTEGTEQDQTWRRGDTELCSLDFRCRKNQARAEVAERADISFFRVLGDIGASRASRGWPTPALAGVQGHTGTEHTNASESKSARVLDSSVPSAREARSGQPGFFSAPSAPSARALRDSVTPC